MDGLAWLEMSDACDLLRVTDDNAAIVSGHARSIPRLVEVQTGYPAYMTDSESCDETVKVLARFMLLRLFDPDGLDADQLGRVIDSLTKTVKAIVIAEGLEDA